MNDSNRHNEIEFRLTAEEIGRLFMPRASTFEVLSASVLQEQFVVDSLMAESERGRCRLTFSEWEEDAAEGSGKLWVAEYAIELCIGDTIAFATYSTSFTAEQRDSPLLYEALKRAAENDFMLCAKLIGRSVRRDLVIDQDLNDDRIQPGMAVH